MMSLYRIEEIAKNVIVASGSHQPQIMFDIKDKIVATVLMFQDDKQKLVFQKAFRTFITDAKIPKYWVIMEGWLGNKAKVRPRDDSEKKEALIIQEFSSDLKSKTIINVFHKKDGQVIFDERKEFDEKCEQASTWNFYLEDCMAEKMDQLRGNEK
jgi:hypothetical protein